MSHHAEFIENTLCALLLKPTCPELHAQLRYVESVLSPTFQEEFPVIHDRLLTQKFQEILDSLNPSCLRVNFDSFVRTLSGTAGDVDILQLPLHRQITVVDVSSCLNRYLASIPIEFPQTTEKLKEIISLTPPTMKQQQTKSEMGTTNTNSNGNGGSSTVRSCSSVFHKKYGGDGKASTSCPFCMMCHMLEGLLHNYQRSCCFKSHAFPPTVKLLERRLGKYPKLLNVACEQLRTFNQDGAVSNVA
eukprot:PhF_6_TR41072/c0_g1_i1/m.62215